MPLLHMVGMAFQIGAGAKIMIVEFQVQIMCLQIDERQDAGGINSEYQRRFRLGIVQ